MGFPTLVWVWMCVCVRVATQQSGMEVFIDHVSGESNAAYLGKRRACHHGHYRCQSGAAKCGHCHGLFRHCCELPATSATKRIHLLLLRIYIMATVPGHEEHPMSDTHPVNLSLSLASSSVISSLSFLSHTILPSRIYRSRSPG